MEDLESELGQGVQLPDNIGLHLVLSYCVHNCYTKTAQVYPHHAPSVVR
jgi:hypothetical protein